MSVLQCAGREVVEALTANNFTVVGRSSTHVTLRYDHPTDLEDVRLVTVPTHDRIYECTLRHIAASAGAEEFDAFCRWIDRNR